MYKDIFKKRYACAKKVAPIKNKIMMQVFLIWKEIRMRKEGCPN